MEERPMERIVLPRSLRRPIAFTGRKAAEAATGLRWSDQDFSGRTGHSTSVTIYEADDGRYVAHVAEISQWPGDPPVIDTVTVMPDIDAVIGWLRSRRRLPIAFRDRLIGQLDPPPEDISEIPSDA